MKYELTEEEYEMLDGLTSKLYGLKSTLEKIVHPAIIASIDAMMSLVDGGIGRIRSEQEQKDNEQREKWDKALDDLLGPSIWCIHEVEPTDEHPWSKADKVYVCSAFDIDIEVQGPTWLDMAIACDRAVTVSEDRRHIYVEELSVCRTERGAIFLKMGLGS